MDRDNEVNTNSNSLLENDDIDPSDYLFYVIKNRPGLSRRRSSLQSWQQRHRIKIVRRLVRKSGKSSIHQKSSKERSFRFLLDLSNTLIESSWIWTFLVVSFIFTLTWFMFAGFWAIISIENVDAWNGTSDSCLKGIDSFSGYLLFSIETQTTIGYGGRYINEYCPEAIIGLIIQLIIGAGVCGSLICIVFLKMVAPVKNRHSMVCFSKKAVICQRDGELCLIFRVRDYDMRYECHTKIVAYLVKERGGELSLKVLKLEPTGILIWPVEVIHKIDETSPFWDLSAKDLILKRFEIIVVLEGECLSTSYMSRSTTSYLSREIKWGYKFTPCTTWNTVKRTYVVDHKLFNNTEEVVTALCSAQRLVQVYDDIVSDTLSPYNGSVFGSSKYSSPTIMSPMPTTNLHNKSNISNVDELDVDTSSEDEINSTRAEIHYKPNKSEKSDSSSSAEEYSTFMDLSVESLDQLRKKKKVSVQVRSKLESGSDSRPRTLSGTAKDFISSIQRYVGTSKNRGSRKYEETSF
ncbi:unnamed protein product [Ceutorhynchus assimilis]|uniref:Uncharacterized protein n=1 Tax=Ceutorhynchus assimilis TaxID=467358 RepID=A0A9N9MPQ4_9CUCU|nr:unnamed protein product [Ceutorhynchus assimilis]